MGIDLSQYMQAYIDGSRENLDTMDRMLLALEQNPANLEAVEEIFRAAHTLKGMSGTMGFEKIAHLTHEMESVLDKLRNKEIEVTAQIIDIIFETFDVLRILVNDSISQTDTNVDLDGISKKLVSIDRGTLPPRPSPQTPQNSSPASQGSSGYQSVGAVSQNGTSQFGIIEQLGEFDITDYEVSVLLDNLHGGRSLFLMTVALLSDCLLKGPRVFMVLRNLDSLNCEIIKSYPEVKDLEQERFDSSFKMILAGEREPHEILGSIEEISEISSVAVEQIHEHDLTGGAPPQPQQPQVSAPITTVSETPIPSMPASEKKATERKIVPTAVGQGSREREEEEGDDDDDDDDDKEEVKETIELVQLVSFSMAGETYALEIAKVDGIINLIPVTRVPKAPNYFEGVINMRGEIVPVINLRKRLKLAPKEDISDCQIVILTFDIDKVKVGFLVDHVNEVLRLPRNSIEAPNRVSESVDVAHLLGVGKLGSQIIILLNAEKIVFDHAS